MIFKSYVHKAALAHYDEPYDIHRTPPLAATLKVPLEEKHQGAKFRVMLAGVVRRFQIEHVSHVYEVDKIGEVDAHGDFRIVTAQEIFETTAAPETTS